VVKGSLPLQHWPVRYPKEYMSSVDDTYIGKITAKSEKKR